MFEVFVVNCLMVFVFGVCVVLCAAACCFLAGAGRVLFVVCWSLFVVCVVVCCLLVVVRCLSVAACCVLRVTCWMILFVY